MNPVRSEFARHLNVRPNQIRFLRRDSTCRYVLGEVLSPTGQPTSFFKAANPHDSRSETLEQLNQGLEREAAALSLAQELHLTVVRSLRRFIVTATGRGLLELEHLGSLGGVCLNTEEDIRRADAAVGRAMARSALSLAAQPLPRHAGAWSAFEKLAKTDRRSDSVATLEQVWFEKRSTVFDPTHDSLLRALTDADRLREIVTEAWSGFLAQPELSRSGSERFFVQHDTAPSNAFLFRTPSPDWQALLIDFEHAGLTSHRLLALTADLGNLVGRCWPTPRLQAVVLEEIKRHLTERGIRDSRAFTRFLFIFATLYLAAYGMNTNHPEHQMTRSLLKNVIDLHDAV